MKKLSLAKYHGGKNYLAKWIISHFPPDYRELVFIEAYGGMANVTLQKEKSYQEYVGDIDGEVINLWYAVRDNSTALIHCLKEISYSEESFKHAIDYLKNIGKIKHQPFLPAAINTYVKFRMSRGGIGKDFAWSERLRGGKPGDVNAWENAIKQIPAISERVKAVNFYHGKALNLMEKHKGPNALAYLDPTYLKETRVAKTVYANEMSYEDHVELLDYINNFPGKVLLSGYRSDLYDTKLNNWNRHEKEIANHSSQAKTKKKKVECLWANY